MNGNKNGRQLKLQKEENYTPNEFVRLTNTNVAKKFTNAFLQCPAHLLHPPQFFTSIFIYSCRVDVASGLGHGFFPFIPANSPRGARVVAPINFEKENTVDPPGVTRASGIIAQLEMCCR